MMNRHFFVAFALCIALPTVNGRNAENGLTNALKTESKRVNHDGRTLAQQPQVTQPLLFNTAAADRVLASMQVLPVDSPWNQDIRQASVAKNSAQMIAAIGATQPLKFNRDMAFVIVPEDQKRVPVTIGLYARESDPGPFPIPDNAPIEGWPITGGALENLQEHGDGDRHVIVVDPGNKRLYEFGEVYKKNGAWSAAVAAVFDLDTNRSRPRFWTSADAAGLPIFPAIVRFDEVERGMVEHAMRFTVQKTRRAFLPPATHYASRSLDENLPAMGQRFRLKPDVDLSGLSPHALAVAKGLQKYGMFVADNGGNWRLSVAPDERIKGLEGLLRFKGADFEVVVPQSQ
jgi:hypothetical protein